MSDQSQDRIPSCSDPAGPRVVVVADTHDSLDRARQLAARLNLPWADAVPNDADILLRVHVDHLALSVAGPRTIGAVSADFRASARPAGTRRQPIARAIGVAEPPPTVVDATAGLGRDAFLLASLGCRVTAVERNPIVAELLRDALDRARSVPRLEEIIDQGITVIVGDARDMLRCLPEHEAPDVVYLDPMYPRAPKASALAKKEMRLFRLLVGDDEDAGELLTVARKVALRRVVVKRMLHARPLGPESDLAFKGKIVRYDVYLTRR